MFCCGSGDLTHAFAEASIERRTCLGQKRKATWACSSFQSRKRGSLTVSMPQSNSSPHGRRAYRQACGKLTPNNVLQSFFVRVVEGQDCLGPVLQDVAHFQFSLSRSREAPDRPQFPWRSDDRLSLALVENGSDEREQRAGTWHTRSCDPSAVVLVLTLTALQ